MDTKTYDNTIRPPCKQQNSPASEEAGEFNGSVSFSGT
jgi:hypothetical protein